MVVGVDGGDGLCRCWGGGGGVGVFGAIKSDSPFPPLTLLSPPLPPITSPLSYPERPWDLILGK